MEMEKKWEVVFEVLDILEGKSGQLLTCKQVQEILAAKGLEVTLQKVQRDMRDLLGANRVESNGLSGRSLAYRVPRKNKVNFYGQVKPDKLFSFLLWSKVLGELLRDQTGVEPFLRILEQQSPTESAKYGKDLFRDYQAKIGGLVFFAGQQTVVGPRENVAPVLLEALLKSRKVEVLYESQQDLKPRLRTLEPWCLLVYRQELYFLCPGSKSKDQLVRYKLGRVHSAKLLKNEQFVRNESLLRKEQEHLQNTGGMWDERDSKAQKIRLAFSWPMRHYMSEVHFCRSQRVILHEDIANPEESWCEVTMQVPIGTDLLDWVRRWGDGCEVLGPQVLKDAMREYGEWLVEVYE
jgi:predicted DNA-binding transcriptional regulator YafY